MRGVKNFLRKKTVGYWLSLFGAVLSLITAVVYAAAYAGSNYMSWLSFAMLLFAFAAFLLLSAFDISAPFAPAAAGIFDLVAMCLYIDGIYMYLTEVFYGGVNAASMAELDPAFVFCLLAEIVCVGLGIAGVFMRQRRPVAKKKSSAVRKAGTAMKGGER